MNMHRSLSKVFFVTLFIPFIMCLVVKDGLSAEQYPTKPVTVVVTWGPGMSDTISRSICKAAEKYLGQPIIVVNKPGAAGTIGMNYIAKAKPDGYTLGVPVSSAYVIHPHRRKVAYNAFTDIIDIATIFKYNFALAVRADAPWNTFEEVVEYARKNPYRFTYGGAGVGVPQHITMEQIAMKEGVKFTYVPFQTGPKATAACLGGHTSAVAQGSVNLLPHLEAGKLKLLLTLDDRRWPAFPNVPNILEKYDFCGFSYMSLVAPKGVSESIIKKLQDVFSKAKKDPSFIAVLKKYQVEPGDLSGEEYSKLWRSRYDEMGKIIKALGLQQK